MPRDFHHGLLGRKDRFADVLNRTDTWAWVPDTVSGSGCSAGLREWPHGHQHPAHHPSSRAALRRRRPVLPPAWRMSGPHRLARRAMRSARAWRRDRMIERRAARIAGRVADGSAELVRPAAVEPASMRVGTSFEPRNRGPWLVW